MRFPSFRTAWPALLLLLVLAVYVVLSMQELRQVEFSGPTQGTTYTVKYLSKDGTSYQSSVDSLLVAFSKALSTYDTTSEITRFNRGTCIALESPYWYPLLLACKRFHYLSEGAFEPTLQPVLQAWSVAKKSSTIPDSIQIDSLMQLVGFEKISFSEDSLCKLQPGAMLNFNAIAPGYSVDLLAELLSLRGIENYMIEIGGELACKGLNAQGKPWTIGLDDPVLVESGKQAMKATVQVVNRALATSGNYRNFFEVNGKKYGHTINPKTGFPAMQNILIATILAPDCTSADALATICMVLGLEGAVPLLESQKGIDAYLVYTTVTGEVRTYRTRGLEGLLVPVEQNP
jgi:thiamine biosynthesis lipoprotein